MLRTEPLDSAAGIAEARLAMGAPRRDGRQVRDAEVPARGDPGPAVLAIALAGAGVRLALAALVPMTNDEAYYADWARHLAPGYLDHPPMVAWLLAGSVRLLGETALAARLPAVVLQTGTTLLAASLARARGGERAAVVAALLLQAAPVFSLGAVLITPDAPLAFAWTGALWAFERAFRRGPRWFLGAGAFLGLAALSKLTAGLLGLALLGALLASREGRRALAGPWPWASLLLAVAIASPMLLWNAARGWPSLAFQLEHGARGRSFSLGRLAGSIGAQAAYVSPVIFVLAALAAIAGWRGLRALRDPPAAALALSALPVVALFTVAASLTPGALPHWPAPGWLSATLLLAIEGGRLLRPALAVGFASTALVLGALAVPPSLPGQPLDELRGWREGAAAAREAAGPARLATAHWIVLGQLGWYDHASPAYLGDRPSGPTFYGSPPGERGEPLLVVTVDGLGPQRERLEEKLGALEPVGTFTARVGEREVRRLRFYRWSPEPERRADTVR